MEKEATRPPPAEDTSSTTDVDDKETAPPSRSEDKKDVDMAMSPLDEPPKTPEKVSGEEKSDDEYPRGMALFFIMLGLNLAVFLVAIGKSPFFCVQRKGLKLTFTKIRPNNYCTSFMLGYP
jgi:hypothetical protein